MHLSEPQWIVSQMTDGTFYVKCTIDYIEDWLSETYVWHFSLPAPPTELDKQLMVNLHVKQWLPYFEPKVIAKRIEDYDRARKALSHYSMR